MLDREGLFSLLNLEVGVNAPGLVIYCVQKTERLNYVCEFIFKHVLKVNYTITDQFGEFENAPGFKINYSAKDFDKIFQITPHSLIMEKGISEIKPGPVFKNNLLYFYENKNKLKGNDFHFDPFSAVFYLISRYEEWQAFDPDIHGRFEAGSSILFRNNFHLKPVVDSWILELKSALESTYPSLRFPAKKFKIISTIDIDNLFAYKSKGFLRTLGACFRDMLVFDFINLKERLLVLSGKKEGPFDIYAPVSEFCLTNQVPLICFFLFKTGTRYDRTVNPGSTAFKKVFDILKSNRALIGIHPSYHSAYEDTLLKNEIKNLAESSSKKISFSRQHFLRFDIRSTPGKLLENGIIADFTMGFASSPGFRAGTSHPFYYFNFDLEKKSDLLFVPFCAMDGAYTVYKNVSPENTMQSLTELALEVKKTEGYFITVFHERTFYDHLYKGFGSLYKNLHLKLKEL